ncbi:MAG: type VI secretion system secreted protein Hcp [Gammaproteobacteria bacterium]|jgi:type VI secretion system secreted protein Hcp
MALEMFLRIDGVAGGSRNYQHKGWADMLSWNWNLEHSSEKSAADSLQCENMNQITVLKAIGKESAALLKLFVERTPISAVEISVMPVVGKRESSQKYLAILMEDVVISSVRTDGEAEENFFRERLILTFGKINYEFFQYAASAPNAATSEGESFTFGWDLNTNTAV